MPETKKPQTTKKLQLSEVKLLDQINNFMEVERTRGLWHLITVFLIKFKSRRGIQILLFSGKYPTNHITLMLCLSFSNISATLSCLKCALIQINFHSLVKIFFYKVPSISLKVLLRILWNNHPADGFRFLFILPCPRAKSSKLKAYFLALLRIFLNWFVSDIFSLLVPCLYYLSRSYIF